MAVKKKPEKVTDKNAFINGIRNGVLIHHGVKMRVGGEMRLCHPGDVIVPDAADLDNPERPGSFVATVALHCRGLRDGRRRSGMGMSVYADKKLLATATKELNDRIVQQETQAATQQIEKELARMNTQGRGVTTIDALDRMIERALGSDASEKIVAAIRIALMEELKLQPA